MGHKHLYSHQDRMGTASRGIPSTYAQNIGPFRHNPTAFSSLDRFSPGPGGTISAGGSRVSWMEKEKGRKALPKEEVSSPLPVPASLPWGCCSIQLGNSLLLPSDGLTPGQHFWRGTWQIIQALTYLNRVILEPQLSSHMLFSPITKTRHLVFHSPFFPTEKRLLNPNPCF